MLEIAWQVTPPPGLLGVMACLWKDPFLEEAHVVPQDPLRIAAIVEPTMVTMSASCIVKGEAMRVTYMDTMTTSCRASGP